MIYYITINVYREQLSFASIIDIKEPTSEIALASFINYFETLERISTGFPDLKYFTSVNVQLAIKNELKTEYIINFGIGSTKNVKNVKVSFSRMFVDPVQYLTHQLPLFRDFFVKGLNELPP